MKRIYAILGIALLTGSMSAQTVVFSSDLSSWTNNLPDDMMGLKSNIPTTDVIEVTTGVLYGTSAAQLVNTTTTHKRFSTQPVSVTDQQGYEITVWAKGQGDIRFGLFDNNTGASAGYTTYTSYQTINSTTTQAYSGQILATNTYTDGEFIVSLKSTVAPDHIIIDSIEVKEVTILPPTAISIYDIQYTTASPANSPYLGQTVSTGGIVTYVKSNGSFYMANGVGPYTAIYVYTTQQTVSPGDSVTFEAQVDEFNGLTELKFPNNFVIVSSGNLFFSNSVTTAEANSEAYESALVSVCGQCTNTADLATYGDWDVNDGSGDATVGDFLISTYPTTPTVGTYYSVKGIVDCYNDYFSILPRNSGDMTISTTSCANGIEGNELVQFSLYPNPAETNITIDVDGTHLLTITDLSGKVITKKMITGVTSIPVNEFVSGVYFFSLDGNVSKVIVK
ncbi:MAG: T9SS type A sorting domain-containing protein [Flavobacteriales bacterium]|nr:T9SS type A sorting domain-containing protein [Flavobacteriales bacterium]MCB9198260.1 T9SS type A sorting domain-containing protein [Flavobacteriales bacterium]